MKPNPLINYTKEAFALPANLGYLLALIGGTVAGIAVGLPPELVIAGMSIGSGLEMLYLAVMPRNRRFLRAVNAKRAPLTDRVSQQVRSLRYLSMLDKQSIERYTALYRKKNQIADNLVRQTAGSGSAAFLDAYLAKLNALETFYAQLLFDIDQYQKFLQTETGERLLQQQRQMETEMAGSTSTRVQDLYKRRIELIQKRREKNLSVQEQLQMAQIQLATLEDTVNYLLEQSITINNPDEITRMIDHVLNETEEHYQSMIDIQQITDGAPTLPDLPNLDVAQFDMPPRQNPLPNT